MALKDNTGKSSLYEDTMEEAKRANSLGLAGGTERMKFEMTWAIAGKVRHHTLSDCEFDGQPLGPLNRSALHNPIFLPKHLDTLSQERQRWKLCVRAFTFHKCSSLALVLAMGNFANYCGWTVECIEWRVWDTDRETERDNREQERAREKCDNVHGSWSPLSLLKQVGTKTLQQSTRRHMHTSAFSCLSVKGLRRPSKRGIEIG